MTTRFLEIFGAFYALFAIALTVYNFGRAPGRKAADRRIVLASVTVFALGVSFDGLAHGGVLHEAFGWPTSVEVVIAHTLIPIGVAIFLSFSLKTYQDIRTNEGLKLGRAVGTVVILAAAIISALAAFAMPFIYGTVGFQIAEVLLSLTLVLLLVACIIVWTRVRELSRSSSVNVRLALLMTLTAFVAHAAGQMGYAHDEMIALYIGVLLTGVTFWISATFDVAEGRV